jgi:hypothetical protein
MSDNNSPTIQASGYPYTPQQNFQGLNTKFHDMMDYNRQNNLPANYYSHPKNTKIYNFRQVSTQGNGGKRRNKRTQKRRKRKGGKSKRRRRM